MDSMSTTVAPAWTTAPGSTGVARTVPGTGEVNVSKALQHQAGSSTPSNTAGDNARGLRLESPEWVVASYEVCTQPEVLLLHSSCSCHLAPPVSVTALWNCQAHLSPISDPDESYQAEISVSVIDSMNS